MTEQIVTVRFRYNGKSRIVDNVTENDTIICGFEMNKSGQFSYQVKRFRKANIEGDVEYIDPVRRSGPTVGRP